MRLSRCASIFRWLFIFGAATRETYSVSEREREWIPPPSAAALCSLACEYSSGRLSRCVHDVNQCLLCCSTGGEALSCGRRRHNAPLVLPTTVLTDLELDHSSQTTWEVGVLLAFKF